MRKTCERSGSLWVPSRREMLGALGVGLLAPRPARAATFSLIGSPVGGGLGKDPTKTIGPLDTTGADLLVIVLASSDAEPPSQSGTDSKGNTWTALTASVRAGWSQCRIWYCVPGSKVGTGHAVTWTASGSFYLSGYFAAFSGCNPIGTVDQQSGAANATSPGSITPSQNNELVVAGISAWPQPVVSVDASMTLLGANVRDGGSNYCTCGIAYKIQTTAAPINPAWNTSDALVIASFKSASGGGVRHRVVSGGE
jgi:hypothetical protein